MFSLEKLLQLSAKSKALSVYLKLVRFIIPKKRSHTEEKMLLNSSSYQFHSLH